ncbi:MAG TPA: hypothetical protein VIM19_16995 [Actinomycetes bacterium]
MLFMIVVPILGMLIYLIAGAEA